MMRKMICFLMVLVMSLTLACPALAATNSTGNGSSDIPRTGDGIMLYIVIMAVALVALIAVVMFSRKAFKK